MIRAGSHGMLWVAGDPVARCTQWKLNIERDVRENTPVYRWDERSIPLKRSGTGDITILYDPEDIGAAAIISSFRSNEPPPVELHLRTDKTADEGYDCNAHIASVGTSVAVRSAHQVSINFTVTGPITQL